MKNSPDDYYDFDRQIEIHQGLLDQMRADGKMFHNPVQNYWTPRPEHLDEYHRLSGVIMLLGHLKKLWGPK